MSELGSDVLAFTVSYGDRKFLSGCVKDMRATAGKWFDWGVWLGAPSEGAEEAARGLLTQEDRRGIQYLKVWDENRGQHWAMKEALELARSKGYKWLLRLDDDVSSKSKNWLKHLVGHTQELRRKSGDKFDRIVSGPRVIGLRNQVPAEGVIGLGQKFKAEVVPLLGGVCRLHPVELLEDFEPSVYSPTGRGDPQEIAEYLHNKVMGGMQVRFPGVRVVHHTDQLEAEDSEETSYQRKMGYYWPWLGEGA